MSQIAESELIIDNRGAIYHLGLRPEEIANTIITVGDPDRVKEVSKYFDEIEIKHQHREFVTHTGRVGAKRLTVLSSGIGPDNIDIVINELDALANIDLESRTVKAEHKSLNIIRLGTSGALQADIKVDGLVASTHGLGIDNLISFYRHEQNAEENEILNAFITHMPLHTTMSTPYITRGAGSLIKHFVDGFYHGITVTCPGFYGPQGRILRLGLRSPNYIEKLTDFRFGSHRITNFEMETSAIYGLGKMLGHNCLALNAIVANRVNKTFSKDGKAAVEQLIKKFITIFDDNF